MLTDCVKKLCFQLAHKLGVPRGQIAGFVRIGLVVVVPVKIAILEIIPREGNMKPRVIADGLLRIVVESLGGWVVVPAAETARGLRLPGGFRGSKEQIDMFQVHHLRARHSQRFEDEFGGAFPHPDHAEF